jgi:succinoglycan biosynthesis transport protein ExoP
LELKEVLDAFRAKRAWIIGGVLVGLLLAALFNWTTERTYASTSQLFVNVPSPPDEIAPLDADTYSQQRMVSYIQVLTGREVAQRVVDELQLPLTAKMVQEKVSATPVPGTVILEIEVIDSSPERAQAIADSAGRQFASKIAELETPRQAGGPIVEIETLQAADFDAVPAAPGVRRNLMLGVALGLVVGLGLALLRSRMDRTLRLEADVREAADADLVGGVPEDRHLAARHVPADGSGQSAVTEAFRAIRVNLRRADGNGAPQVVVVTSSLPQEGASTVAVNLAVSFTRSGSRVILVDGNLRKPRVARYLGLTDGPGLTDVIAGRADLQQVTQSRENGTLSVLGAGHLSSDTDAVLDSPRMRALSKTLRDTYDVVIIDTPPLLSVIDAAALSALADGCLLVARFGRTTQDDLAEATSTLARVHARLFGVVLNRVPPKAANGQRRRKYTADSERMSSPPEDGQALRAGDPNATSTGRVPAGSAGGEARMAVRRPHLIRRPLLP